VGSDDNVDREVVSFSDQGIVLNDLISPDPTAPASFHSRGHLLIIAPNAGAGKFFSLNL